MPELEARIRKLEEQMALHRHTETDRTRKIYPHAFYGRVESDGTATDIPDGWSVSRTGAGNYTVTHNLGHTEYGVTLAYDYQDDPSNNVKVIAIKDYDANSFQVNTVRYPFTAGTDADSDFFFILVKRS